MNRRIFRVLAVVGLAATLGCASTAAAGDKHSHTSTQRTIVLEEDGQKIKIKINDGEVRAWINGEEVDASELGDRLNFADDGNVIWKNMDSKISFGALQAPKAPEAPKLPKAKAPAPRPVIGVSVSPRSYGEDKIGLIIESLREGFPAAAAGIKAGDIIVEIQGVDKVDTRGLLEVIGEAGHGGEFQVKVLRGDDVSKKIIRLPDAVHVEAEGRFVVGERRSEPRSPRAVVVRPERIKELEIRARELDNVRKEAEAARRHAEGMARKWMENNQDRVIEMEIRAHELAERFENLNLEKLKNFEVLENFEGLDGEVEFFTFQGQEMAEEFEEQIEEFAERFEEIEEELDERIDELAEELDERLEEIEERVEEAFEGLEERLVEALEEALEDN